MNSLTDDATISTEKKNKMRIILSPVIATLFLWRVIMTKLMPSFLSLSNITLRGSVFMCSGDFSAFLHLCLPLAFLIFTFLLPSTIITHSLVTYGLYFLLQPVVNSSHCDLSSSFRILWGPLACKPECGPICYAHLCGSALHLSVQVWYLPSFFMPLTWHWHVLILFPW